MILQKKILIPLGIILGIYFGLSIYVTMLSFQSISNVHEETPSQYSLQFEKVAFQAQDNPEIILQAWWLPNKNEKQAIIFAHGIDANRAIRLKMFSEIHDLGYPVLLFDIRGHGESTKTKVGLTVKDIGDINGAIDYLKKEKNIEQVLLFGTSYGASLVLQSAHTNQSVKGVIADAPFNDLVDLLAGEVARRTPIPSFIAGQLRHGIIWSAKLYQGIDLRQITPAENANKLDYPIMLIHCTDDDRIPINHADEIYAEAPPNSTYLKYDNCGGHDLAYTEFQENYLKEIKIYISAQLN
ncbi:MAG: Pimeloyl-ACP methyl ester carboxylesterase [Chloroflexi bacterium]|nr:MAG: Pimeloyl-ACP methyl ester carboxylesterase [Chloroflexota bacterium]